MIDGTLKISAPISPYGESDNYPTHLARYGKGGYRTCKTLLERDSIPDLKREEGMFVFCQEDQGWYILVGGIKNDCWHNFRELVYKDASGFMIIDETEPENPTKEMIWLNPKTGMVLYRNQDNSQWEQLISQNVDGGSF